MVAFGNQKSVSKVVAVIRKSEGVSQRELVLATGLSERSVKYALKELVQKKQASSHVLLSDARRKLYYREVEK